jgi:hypothetical protein
MSDFEKLGVFYLGRAYDLETRKSTGSLVLYDSKDLVTHAVCVGMTGSGKTGLCLALLEEAALDGIPAILIDPKGDLGNVLLTFPELRPEDFAPWVNEDDARRKGLTRDDYARQQADLWQKGLAGWGQDGARIRRLRDAADFAIYTPGSNTGLPLSILKSFGVPPPEVRGDSEALRERIGVTATSLLGLLGIEADPIQSREHILISTVLGAAWNDGRDLDLPALIQLIQRPPMARIGVLDLDTFYPPKDRFELAMKLNNLLASPGFAAWMEGEPLDVGAMLHTREGKSRLSIVSIAHLGDSERMFFVALLLNQVTAWMRAQPGTTSLRAILYMDEIFGYFPPVANPPSKLPLLTLLKQARAFGLGVVLATQNPVDLDYKGLANAGTWFIGRLQTERDKARMVEGLEGIVTGAGKGFDRPAMERVLAGLGSRIFLMHNVHENSPEIFETRWVMSYLRGPLTRDQIKRLMDPHKAAPRPAGAPGGPAVVPAGTVQAGEVAAGGPAIRATGPPVAAAGQAAGSGRPVLPPAIPQHFVPARGSEPEGAGLVYRPMLIGSGQIRFADTKKGVDVTQDVTVLTPVTGGAVAVDWEQSETVDLAIGDLEATPRDGAGFAELPAAAGNAKSYQAWSRDFAGWLHRSKKLELFKCGKELSRHGESEGDFRVRLRQAAHEQRDEVTERLRQKYAPKIAALQERIRRADQVVQREREQSTQSQIQTAISVGATLLGAFLGRKTMTTSTLGRATTAVRGAGRAMKEHQDIGRAQETVATLQRQLADLEAQFQAETERLGEKIDPAAAPLETIALRPTRQNITVRLVALAWTPWWQDTRGGLAPAWQ